MVTEDKREREGQAQQVTEKKVAFNFSRGTFNVFLDPSKRCSDFIIKDRPDDGGAILQSLAEQQIIFK